MTKGADSAKAEITHRRSGERERKRKIAKEGQAEREKEGASRTGSSGSPGSRSKGSTIRHKDGPFNKPGGLAGRARRTKLLAPTRPKRDACLILQVGKES